MNKSIFVIFIGSLLYAQTGRLVTLFETPTAFFPQDETFWEGSVSFTVSTNPGEANHPQDFNLNVNMTKNGRYGFGLNFFTLRDFSLDASYRVTDEVGYIPAVAIGVRNITYKKYVSPAGGEAPEGNFEDENYLFPKPRTPELLSAYVVTGKHLMRNLILHLGFGRGEFVGYGPRSKYLNTDLFFDKGHEYSAIGLFGGFEFYIISSLSLIVELDARDMNIGLKGHLGYLNWILKAAKLEHSFFGGTEAGLYPRVSLGFSFNSRYFTGRVIPPSLLVLTIYNKETKRAVPNALIRFPGTEIPGGKANSQGVVQFSVTPGIYELSIESPNYKTLTPKLKISEGGKTYRVKVPLVPMVSKASVAQEWITRGDGYWQTGELLRAESAYEQALKSYPENKVAQTRLEQIRKAIDNKKIELFSQAGDYERKGNYDSAINSWREYLKYDPDNLIAKQKIEELRKASREKVIKPSPPPPRKKAPPKPAKPSKAEIEKTLNQAISLFNAGKYKDSKALLQKVLKWDPGNSLAKTYLDKANRRLELLGE